MGRGKEKFIEETGGFRIEGASMMLLRTRFAELRNKLRIGSITDAEKAEFLHIHDKLPDDDEFDLAD